MITVTKIVNVSASGVAPYTYQWINGDSGCVSSFSVPNGTSADGIIQTDVVFNSSACAGDANISLYVEDSKGCKATFPIVIGNPCDTLTSTGFSEQLNGLNLTLTALHTGTSPGNTYSWTWDNSIFSGNDQGTDTIQLTIRDSHPPVSSTSIFVTVTTSEGCTLTTEYTYSFCEPLAQNDDITLCVVQNMSTIHQVCLSATPCAGEIDWDTLNFTFEKTTANYFNVVSNDGNGCITIAQNGLGPAGTYTGTWTVQDVNGNTSTTATFTINYEICGSPGSCIVAPTFKRDMACDETGAVAPQTYVMVDLDAEVVSTYDPETNTSGCQPDWSTFEFIQYGSQVATGTGESASMTTAFGQVDFNANHEITYTFTSLPPTGTETVRWKVAADNGDETGEVDLVIIYDCTTGPTAVVDAYCQACENTPTSYDVLANDTGSGINPASIVITNYPPVTEGTLNVNLTAGTIKFVPATGFTGVSTYDYKVANWSGIYSNEATVTVTSNCADAGTSTSLYSCVSLETVHDLFTLISSSDTTGAWELTSAPTDPVSINVDGTTASYAVGATVGIDHEPLVYLVDGTSPSGTYVFTYEVTDGCSTTTQTVTITGAVVTVSEVASTCTYTYSIENPDTGTSAWDASISADDIYVTEEVRFKVTKDCGTPSVISNTVITDTSQYMYTQASQATVFTDLITVGGYLEDVKVYHWDGSIETPYVLDVSPTGSNLIGPAGTISGGDLIFDGSNYALLGPRLDTVIKNAIANQISLNITDINVTCNITSGGYFTIKTRAKHAPTGDWVAIKSTDSSVNFDIDGATSANATTVVKATSILAPEVLKQTYSTVCGDITALALPSGAIINTTSSEYNSIVLNGGVTMSISGGDGNPTTLICDERTLTATLAPSCPLGGTVTYLWDTGETTQTIVTSTLGLHSCYVTCSTYGCTAQGDITLV